MAHFIDGYSKLVNELLHEFLPSTWFYRHEVYEVPDLATALVITHDDNRADSREYHSGTTWEQFLTRMCRIKADWKDVSRETMASFLQHPDKTWAGAEGRAFYFIKGGANPQYWTTERARTDAMLILTSAANMWGPMIDAELTNANTLIPSGREHFAVYERLMRVAFTYLFRRDLTNGRPQVRTVPDNEGLEIRDAIFSNSSEQGFWKDLKDKYDCSEVIVDAKNKHELTRDDLRQLYCYLKPAIGRWGFIVCRSPQADAIHTYNKTLFQNFTQTRGLTILSDSDLQNMFSMAKRDKDPSEYLRERKAEFVRSV